MGVCGTYAAGDLAPRGNPDGQLTAADVLILQRFILDSETPTGFELSIADVAPFGSPDGALNTGDLVVLMRAVMGNITLPAITLPDSPTLDALPAATSDNPIAINGTATPNAMVRLYVNGIQEASIISSASDGRFSTKLPLRDGDSTIHAVIWDGQQEGAPSPGQTIAYQNLIPRQQTNTNIVQDTVWTPGATPQPYIISGTLTVQPGNTFILSPGTELRFENGASLTVSGALKILGESNNPVVLTSNRDTPSSGSWRGVVINGQATEVIIQNALIKWARIGIDCQDGIGATVQNSVITGFSEAGVRLWSTSGGNINSNTIGQPRPWGNQWASGIDLYHSSPVIQSNSIEGNLLGFSGTTVGIQVGAGSDPTITSANIITENTYGIYVIGDYSDADNNPNPVISGNQIFANTLYNYYVDGIVGGDTMIVDVSQNWWGSSDPNDFMPTIFSHRTAWSNTSPAVVVAPFLIDTVGSTSIVTYLAGYVSTDTTLMSGQTYRVLGELVVLPGATLTIQADATVKFVASSGLFVRGAIQITGSESTPANLLSDRATPGRADWIGMVVGDYFNGVYQDHTSSIEHAFISGADHALRIFDSAINIRFNTILEFGAAGIELNRVSGNLTGNHIENGNGSGVLIWPSTYTPIVTGNTFKNAAKGIQVIRSDADLSANHIEANDIGIEVAGSTYGTPITPRIYNGNVIANNDVGIRVTNNASPQVIGNSLFGNTQYNFYADAFTNPQSTLLNATGNWWGSADATMIVAGIYDYAINAVTSPTVSYSPYLNAPNGSLVESDVLHGILAQDMTISGDAPRVLTGGIYVPQGRRLTLEAGATLMFPSGSGLSVAGDLVINGTPDNRVSLLPIDPLESSFGWVGLSVSGSGYREISNAIVQNALVGITASQDNLNINDSQFENNLTAIEFMGNRLDLTGSTFRNNGTAINVHHSYDNITPPYPSGSIIGNEIHDNDIGARLDIVDSADQFILQANRIYNNSVGLEIARRGASLITGNLVTTNGTGIRISGGGLIVGWTTYSWDPVPVLNNNNLFGNIEYNLIADNFNNANVTIDANGNWWGTQSANDIESKILHSVDNPLYPTVAFQPYLSNPVLLAPILTAVAPISASPSLTVSGRGVVGTQVQIIINDLPQAVVDTDANGDFSSTMTLTEGVNRISARAVNGSQQSSLSNELLITLDTTAPLVTVVAPIDGSATNQQHPLVIGYLNEPATLKINNTDVPLDPSLGFSFGPLNLIEGANSIVLDAVDAAGNSAQQTLNLLLDTAAPAAPNPTSLTVIETPGESFRIEGNSGSAEPGAVAVLVNPRTGTDENQTINPDGTFSVPITGLAGDAIYLFIRDSAGNESAWRAYSMSGTAPPPSLLITQPADSDVVATDAIAVQGTVAAGFQTSVTVNGQPAQVHNGNFYARISLRPDSQTIVVQAIDINGAVATDSVTVTSTATSPVTILPDEPEGVAPHKVSFYVTVAATIDVQRMELDQDGDGDIDATTTNPLESLSATYSQAGIYHPRVTVWATNGSSYTADTDILIHSLTAMNATLRGVYDGMLGNLRNGDIPAAMRYTNPGMKAKYEAIFSSIGTGLDALVDQLGTVVGGSIGTDIAQFYIMRDEQGQTMLYSVYFVKAPDGIWRIAEM